jgi:hypothetical protein
MKRRTIRYEARSRASAVEAVSSIRIGDSTSSATGNTTPPYAARLTVDCGSRAITALTVGSSSPMSNQLPASGAQAVTTSRSDSGAGVGAGGAAEVGSDMGDAR